MTKSTTFYYRIFIAFSIAVSVPILCAVFYFWADYVFTQGMRKVHVEESDIAQWIIDVHGVYESRYNKGRHITSVSFQGANVTNTDIKRLCGLSKLTKLRLENPNITDEAIPYINQILSIRELYIRGTKITPAGIEQLNLPNLQYIERGNVSIFFDKE